MTVLLFWASQISPLCWVSLCWVCRGAKIMTWFIFSLFRPVCSCSSCPNESGLETLKIKVFFVKNSTFWNVDNVAVLHGRVRRSNDVDDDDRNVENGASKLVEILSPGELHTAVEVLHYVISCYKVILPLSEICRQSGSLPKWSHLPDLTVMVGS